MEWLQSVQRALNYIEAHLLDGGLDNERVAKEAYSSNANFQRIFSAVLGLTVADYIRFRRLTLAGEELASSDVRVIDAALRYGYETPDSFARAFARFHGFLPSEAKRKAEKIRRFLPVFLRIEVQGGFGMSTKMIPNLPPLVNSWFGENYHFNGAARYVMGCLGEMKLADYSLIAGITGDIFAQFYPLSDFKDDSASDYSLGLSGFPGVFETLGFSSEAFSERALGNDFERLVKKITGSIDRGVPVIWNHGSPKGAVIGYEDDGRTLFYLKDSKTEPERLELGEEFFEDRQADLHGFVVVGEKKREVSLKQLYRDAVFRLPALLTEKTERYVFGAEAFRAWADHIESGAYERMKPEEFEGDFFAYEVHVVNLATNSGASQAFLEKAIEMNPDFGFLEGVRKAYRAVNYLWNRGYWVKDVLTPEERDELVRLYGADTLESLGGAFGCSLETLRSAERRAPIVKLIRRMADLMDRVVSIVSEGLKRC